MTVNSRQPCVVVTGAGAGIGLAISTTLTDAGYAVIGVEWSEKAASVALDAVGSGAIVAGDVREPATHQKALDAVGDHRRLVGWVNNAAVAYPGALHESSPEDVQNLIAINLLGTYWGCAAAVRGFSEEGGPGSIVNLSSIHARAAFPGWAAYDTAKGGVESLTRNVAVEYGHLGVRCNSVAPGAIDTEMMRELVSASPDQYAEQERLRNLHPLARVGRVEEVAEVVHFLLSERSSFVSGQVVGVDGGASARCYRYETDPDLMRKS